MAMCERHHIGDDPNAVFAERWQECYLCRLEHEMARFMPRDPASRYFEHAGWRYGWTTEKMGDGKYAAYIYKPVGPGSRSGKAQSMKMVKELHFAKRTTAKARALKWYRAAKSKAA